MRQIATILKTILLFLTSVAYGQTSTPVDITIDRSGVLLKGKFYISEGEGKFPTVILLHGFPGNELDVLGLGGELSQADINVMTFNYSGTHQSQGLYSFENTQKDIQSAFQFLHQPQNISKYKVDTSRVYLGGYSYGGGMALTYAANHSEIADVFSIAGTDHGEFFREYMRNGQFKQMIDTMFEQLAAPSGPVRFPEGGMPKDLAEKNIAEADSTIDLRRSTPLLAQKNILLVGAWDDVNVTMDHHILPLYRALKKEQAQNVKIVAFQDSHAFKQSRAELAWAIIEWIEAVPETTARKALAERFFRGVWGCDPSVVDDLAAADIVVSYPIFQSLYNSPTIRGRKAVKDLSANFCKTWTDAQVTIHEAVAQGDRVVLLWSFQARNVGPTRNGQQPTNREHSWGGITFFRFDKANKIVAEIGEESEPGPFERAGAGDAVK